MWAVYNNKRESVVQKLLELGSSVNDRNVDGKTALILASEKTINPKIVGLLLDAGADIRVTDNDGKTAYTYALENSELVKEQEILERLKID